MPFSVQWAFAVLAAALPAAAAPFGCDEVSPSKAYTEASSSPSPSGVSLYDATAGQTSMTLFSSESSTWAGIRITGLLSAVCLVVGVFFFEIARRTSLLGEIFDRKRDSKPGRTPPKLLPRPFEFIFSDGYVDAGYAEYARRLGQTDTGRACEQTRGVQAHAGENGEDGDRCDDSSPPAGQTDFFSRTAEEGHQARSEQDELQTKERYDTREKSIVVHVNEDDQESDTWAGTVSRWRDLGGLNTEQGEIFFDNESKSGVQEETPAPLPDTSAESDEDSASMNAGNRPKPSRFRFMFVRPGCKIQFRWGERSWPPPSPSVNQSRQSEESNYDNEESGYKKYRKRKKKQLWLEWYFDCLRRIPPIPWIVQPLPLTESDRELLRCIGLDMFTLLRFLRLGFECTFFPFLLACVTLIPVYYTYGNSMNGYFSITIGHLNAKSPKLWLSWCFALCYHILLLRRIWVEWEVFVDLRQEFLADGDCVHDPDTWKEDHTETLRQFRNSCFIQGVPPTYRSDKDLYEFFDSLFPGMIRRAEMVLHSDELSDLIQERQRFIELYERVCARHSYKQESFRRRASDKSKSCIRCGRTQNRPQEPLIRVGGNFCFGGEQVHAMSYYMTKIHRLNCLVDEEFSALVRRKKRSEEGGGSSKSVLALDANCGNAFVQFKSRAAKQAAMCCNLTNRWEWHSFDMFMAPDPGDMAWNNATIESSTTKTVLFVVELMLIVGILFWSTLGSFIANIGTTVVANNQQISELVLVTPVLVLSLLMIVLPDLFRIIGCRVIFFKTKSENDQFVLKWNLCYRLANFIAVLISSAIYKALLDLRCNPGEVLQSLAKGIIEESQFFLNLVLVAAGVSTMYQLSSGHKVAEYLFLRCLFTDDALSAREKEKMKTPYFLFFGKYVPEFIYVFLIAVVYSTTVPLILGACSVYFYVGSKVYTHNALFVYVQGYEGGGKFMYSINRIFFILLYVSIVVFGAVLYLYENLGACISFVASLLFITSRVDMNIRQRFVKPSLSLSLERAQIMDKEYEGKFGKSTTKEGKKCESSSDAQGISFCCSPHSLEERRGQDQKSRPALRRAGVSVMGLSAGIDLTDKDQWPEDIFRLGQPYILNSGDSDAELDYFLYRQPDLNKESWETKPRPHPAM